MRILVTGATGFIGRHVVHLLRASGNDVVALAHTQHDANSGTVCCDLFNKEDVRRLCREYCPTHLLHLAWGLPSKSYWTSPDNERWRGASLHLMETFCACGGKRAIGVGTCAEYSPVSSPRHEETTPTCPENAYGQAKLATCHGFLAAGNAYQVKTAWARLFYPFGPGDAPHRLIPSACKMFMADASFRSSGGSNIFDFIDVRDAAVMLVQLLLSGRDGVFNIARGKGVPVSDILLQLERLCSKIGLIQFLESAPPIIRIADTTKWESMFAPCPFTDVEKTLLDCIRATAQFGGSMRQACPQ